MPVSFPLDKIPGLPNQAVALIVDQILKFINKIQKEIERVISDAAKLPDGCDCDDPKIQDLLKRIQQIQELIAKIMKLVPILEKIIKLMKLLIAVASAIKATVFLTPIVGQAALLAELAIVQNMILANAGVAVKQLGVIPPSIKASLTATLGGLAGVVTKLDSVCAGQGDSNDEDNPIGAIGVNNELQKAINQLDYSDTIPEKIPKGQWVLISKGVGPAESLVSPTGQPPNPESPHTDEFLNTWVWNGIIDPGTGVAWGTEQSRKDDATMGSEFYTEINVGIDDITAQVDSIEDLVKSQQDLLTSLQEAPAQSYNGTEPPTSGQGKPGDYFIDTRNKFMYGPKTSAGWPLPVKF